MKTSELLEKLCCARDKYNEVVSQSKNGTPNEFWDLLKNKHLDLGLCHLLELLFTWNDMKQLTNEIIFSSDRFYLSGDGYWFEVAQVYESIKDEPLIVMQIVVENCLLSRLELLNKTIKRLESR